MNTIPFSLDLRKLPRQPAPLLHGATTEASGPTGALLMASGVHSSPASLAVNTALGYGLTAPGWCCCISEGRPRGLQKPAAPSLWTELSFISRVLENRKRRQPLLLCLLQFQNASFSLHALSGCPLPLRQGHVGI